MLFLLQDELDRAMRVSLQPTCCWLQWHLLGFGGYGFNWLLWNQRGLVDWECAPTITILCVGGVLLGVNGFEPLVMTCFCVQAMIYIAAVALTQ